MALSPRPTLDGGRVLRITGRKINIATWNVRSMYASGKLANTIKEMKRLNIEILGISEMRWPQSGKCVSGNYIVYHSGSNQRNETGTALIVTKEIDKSVKNFTALSDRVTILQLSTTPININIVQCYAPTAKADDVEVEQFYEEIRQALQTTKKNDINIVMGDINSKIGQGECLDIVGKYGLGTRNERGDRLVQFCQEGNLVVLNTFFALPPRRLYTWKSPRDRADNVVRNQIDFIMVNKRYRNSVLSAKTYPGADVGSDHNPVVTKFRLHLQNNNRRKSNKKWDISKLQNEEIRQKVQQELAQKIQNIPTGNENIEQNWLQLKETINKVGTDNLKPSRPQGKHEWMNDEILELMEKRRLFKNKNERRYREIHKEITRKIKVVKETWLRGKCQEIEALQEKHDNFNLYKKVKEMAGTGQKRYANNILVDDNNKIIIDPEQKMMTWKNYLQNLFNDNRPFEFEIRNNDEGPDIQIDEVRKAIQLAKTGKAMGPDEIPTEMLKLLDDDGLKRLTELINNIYSTGVIPKEWLVSTFVTLPKTKNARKCNEFRTISLMSHALKILLRIVHQRIYSKCEQNITDTQFGFRNNMGTREALFGINVLLQRCKDVNKDVYLCFLDYNKAFDTVRHEKLLSILNDLNLDNRDIRLIRNLYWNQKAKIKLEDQSSEEFDIIKGVRQGCILSPLLFNIYSETIFKEALEHCDKGIVVGGRRINNLRYADDTVLLTEDRDDMQELLNLVIQKSEEYGLTINTKKTKTMVITKQQGNNPHITINNEVLQNTRSIKYLGYILDDQCTYMTEVRSRIEQSRQAFIKMNKVLCNKNLSLDLRIRLVRCYIFSTLLYGAECWTVNKAEIKKLNAFEMWTYRRILKIPWTDRVRNEEVLRRLNKDMEIELTIKRRKLGYLGHLMRHERYKILQEIMQGKIEGKRSVGRRRTSWMKNLRDWSGKSSVSLFRAAVNKVQMALLISDLR